MMQFFVSLGFILLVHGSAFSAQNLKITEVLSNYEQALQKLLLAHDQNPLQKNQNVFSDVVILATYKKLIAPSVSWINGYARVVSSEMAHQYPYHQDLHTLALEYEKHQTSVQKIIKLLPKNVQAQALEIFHESLTKSFGQMCFNIVQQITNQNKTDQSSLACAYQAYRLSYVIKTKSIKLHGAPSLQAFENVMTQNMTTLFSNAVMLAQNSLSSKMSSGLSVQELYKNLKQWYQVLYDVYKNSGNTAQAQAQQNLIAALKIDQQDYAQAQLLQRKAMSLIEKARVAIPLEVNNAGSLLESVNENIATLASGVASYTQAQQLFQAANATVDGTVCQRLALEINDGDLLLRVIQKLWALYLNDQSTTAGFYTFPALSTFVNGQASGETANAVQALQNLESMISDQAGAVNNVGSLISTADSLQVQPILKNVLLFLEENPNISQKNDALLNVSLLQSVQTALAVLNDWLDQLITCTSNSDQTAMAQAMGYAQLLDTLFGKNKNLDQYIAHLPDCLSSDQTWVNFTAQFLYQAGMVSSPADAQALISSADVALPVVLTAADLEQMQTKADGYFAQAQAFEKVQKLVQATSAYEQAMILYQKLYQQELTGMMQIKMLTLANQAKTRFAACSFGSIVASEGSETFGKIINIPAAYTALNYQLSFDPTLMGSALPACMSSLTAGQTVKNLNAADQKDIFALIKGYLVAQKMIDQAIIFTDSSPTFTDYFSDYTLTKVVQASQRAQLIVAQISSYLNNFENVKVESVTLNSSNLVTIALINWPLAALTAPCSTLSTAGTYFDASATLFAPGTTPLNFGGQTYDPGNDVASQQLMLENLGYAYLCEAYQSNVNLAALKQELSSLFPASAKGVSAASLPEGFSAKFNAVSNQLISLQALLYGSSSTAYGYFAQAGNAVIKKKIKEEFLNAYQQYIAFAKTCLIGDPTSFDYQTVVTAINQAYVSWAAELDPVKDVGMIANLNEQIAKLYDFAGQQCLHFSYTMPSFPEIAQKHFMVAAEYYRSARK